jgi:adenylate kinase family enzyme
MAKPIFLVGYMGSGKSTVGKKLALNLSTISLMLTPLLKISPVKRLQKFSKMKEREHSGS